MYIQVGYRHAHCGVVLGRSDTADRGNAFGCHIAFAVQGSEGSDKGSAMKPCIRGYAMTYKSLEEGGKISLDSGSSAKLRARASSGVYVGKYEE